MLIDLHTHTTFSDGLMKVEELVEKAGKRRLKLLALTDHDTVAGLSLFLKLCRKNKIPAIVGIELSTELEGQELHIVGYNFNRFFKQLLQILKQQQHKRIERARKIIARFQKIGIYFDKKTIQNLLSQPNVGKPQLGRAILQGTSNQKILKRVFNFQGNLSDFIGGFLDQPGQFGYVPKKKLDSIKAIKLISSAGGVAALAHPDLDLTNQQRAEYFIKKLKQVGLWGLENPHNRLEAQPFFQKLAQKNNLVLTFGSDTHNIKNIGVKIKKEQFKNILGLLTQN
ncbi:MAG: hypothetical protein A2294_00825 [Candidatus Magasanikbacteria bacterium RIFOXYB2_FULL_38_10]|nr:MAG: hypothetical protein A2294_00825 [Candidatus Magasanikbacteria bacterium RIFOXYB2_FULL_38_10]